MQTRGARRRALLQRKTSEWLALRKEHHVLLKKAVPDDVIDSFHIPSDVHQRHVIFNSTTNDRRRSQIPLCHKQPIVECVKRIALKHFPKLVLADAHVLISEPGCRQQVPHCDYDPSTIQNVPVEKIPRGVILALQDNTSIEVWDTARVHERVYNVRTSDQKTIEIQKGDVVFFDGDLVHAGSAYETKNTRLHVYLDSNLVLRPKNRTFRLDLLD